MSRIVYALPDDSKYKKYYNQDRLFCDVDWEDWRAVVDGFEARFQRWYFEKMLGEHSSYLDLCALCALVEVFSHYESAIEWHEPRHYKEFLRKLDPAFRKHLRAPIVVTRYEDGGWREGKLKDFADVFYAGVRCSLHHHGDLASFAGMSGTRQLVKELPDAGQSVCGRHRFSLVIFDPAELKSRLRQWLHCYCTELREDPDSNKAQRFRTAFQNDFGIVLLAAGEST